MNQFSKITPDGTKDRLFDECEKRGRFTQALRALFESRGFGEVSTPVLEYYDVFDTARAYFSPESIYKLVDHTGRILVLRPDCTIPIARLVASRLKNENGPLRIFYNENIYRYADGNSAISGEIAQMGVEYVGGGLPICDVEIVELACRSLRSVCGADYQLELCHIGYFNALIDSLNTDADTREQIRELVEHKNFPALDQILDRFSDFPAQKALKKLPALFGSAAVLDEARSLFRSEAADKALDYLAYIYRSLSVLGLDNHLTIDLGLVNQADYYTGIIFRGYTAGAGEPVLSGGRYDGLIKEFGEDRPATGFGVNLDILCEKTEATAVIKLPSAAVLVDETSDIKLAFELLDRLGNQRFCAQLLPVASIADAVLQSGFDRTFVVTSSDSREVLA
ncbi:ATP phosphoribosyltransferase regulatory subunit [Oscillospiraceae bacterium LTW-04]|nr:ATP phosphoribosyltransferase regulatory subunit [Oscillospiraceae bacterium MB24-C1]